MLSFLGMIAYIIPYTTPVSTNPVTKNLPNSNLLIYIIMNISRNILIRIFVIRN